MSEIKELEPSKTGAKRTLVKNDKNEYYMVSSVDSFDQGMETMVFPASESGEVTDWGEVWMSRPADHQGGIDAILEGELYDDQEW